MRWMVLITLIASASFAQAGRFGRTNQRTDQGRSTRGLLSGSLAAFEFAPASGAGMTSACACTAITGAKGETAAVARTGNATCSPLGVATTGITTASLVECSANLPRVELSGSSLGVRVEGARTNVCTRFIDYANATWADVGTPTLTGAQASPWTGTYANLAVQFDDNDAVAFEGRTQTVTVTAATQYTMSCFVKAGTLATARLSLDGTTADFTGLSSTTWTLATVTDASSSGVAIAAQALNGSTAAATGTVIWGGCQVEAGAYATSMIPTVAAGVARGVEGVTATIPVDRTDTTICIAATVDPLWSTSGTVPAFGTVAGWAAPVLSLLSYPAGAARFFTSAGSTGVFQSGRQRLVGRDDNVNVTLSINGTTTSTAAGASSDRWTTAMAIGSGASGAVIDGVVSLVQADPSPSRCSQ
jgi:hypothetical protein